MGEIVNLRRVKKALERGRAAEEAEANRVRHGRTRAEREAASAVQREGRRLLDGARLDGDGEPRE